MRIKASMTLALQLDNDDFAYVHKTLELLAHSLISNYPVEMMSHLVNFLLLQITKIIDNQSARSSGKISRPDELFRLFRKLLAEHYRHEHTIAFYADRLHVSLSFKDYTSGFRKDCKYFYNGSPSHRS